MNFKKYTSYFHDGNVVDVYQSNKDIVFWMESGPIPPEQMRGGIPLTNQSTLRGRLHLEKVSVIYQSDIAVTEIKKQYDSGNIYDFKIENDFALLLITWETEAVKNGKSTDMIDYKIHASHIFWENLPLAIDPINPPIDYFQHNFALGKIFKICQNENEIKITIESAPVQEKTNLPLTKQCTIKGYLVLNWVKKIIIDGNSYKTFPAVFGEAEILRFDIKQHSILMELRWIIKKGLYQNIPITNLNIDFGAINMRWQTRS